MPLRRGRGARLAAYLAAGYAFVVVFASLSPFSGWRDTGATLAALFSLEPPRYWTKFDLVVNVFAYVPLGFLAATALARFGAVALVVGGSLVAFALSLGMEVAQMWLPTRISANLDLAANTAGGIAGSLAALRAGRWRFFVIELARARDRWVVPGNPGDLGFALLALWFFTQLNPSLPLLATGWFSDTVAWELAGWSSKQVSLIAITSAALNLAGVGLLTVLVMRSAVPAFFAVVTLLATSAAIKLVTALLLLRPAGVLAWLSLESGIGIAAGLLLTLAALALDRRSVLMLCVVALVLGVLVSHVCPDETKQALALHLFDWHHGHLLTYTGLARVVSELWPLAALVYLRYLRRRVAGPG